MKITELRHNMWNIGFIEEGLGDTLQNNSPKIHWVRKKFDDRWFADPFILNYNSKEIVVLAEEYCYNVKRGRIARLVIDRETYEEKNYEIILDLPTHLSFPFIYRIKDKIYIIPENSASGGSTVYEYDDAERCLKVLHHVCEEPFTDATIFNFQGAYYLWTTKVPDANGKDLTIYNFDADLLKADKLIDSVRFPNNTARNAGEPFSVNGQLYRPAQDCTKCYGHGVVLQKVICQDGKWIFENANSFYPNSFKYNQGVHTFNNYKGLIVIDARGYRNPILGRLLTCLFGFFGKK